MLQLRISVHEFETPQGAFLGMNAGEFTGVFAPIPVSEEDQEGMKQYVQNKAEYYMTMAPDTELTNGEDMPLGDIQESIRANIVQSCQEGSMSCQDCDGSGKCQNLNGEG